MNHLDKYEDAKKVQVILTEDQLNIIMEIVENEIFRYEDVIDEGEGTGHIIILDAILNALNDAKAI